LESSAFYGNIYGGDKKITNSPVAPNSDERIDGQAELVINIL